MKTRWKILIAIGLGILFSYLSRATPPAQSHHPDHHPTEYSLADANRTINEKFFYGGLPISKIRIHLTDLSADDEMGRVDFLDTGAFLISIDKGTNPTEKEAEFTMIHEDCHIWDKINKINEGIDSHNQNFQDCMIHIAERGGFKDLW